MTLEDIYTGEKREKCEFYEGYTFMCVRSLSPTAVPSALETESVYIVVCDQYIITIHEHAESLPTPWLLQRLAKMSKRLQINSSWIMWTILDQIIDQYIPIVSAMDEECEIIDELVLTIHSSDHTDMLTYVVDTPVGYTATNHLISRRIWHARKNVTQLQRLLTVKNVVLRNLVGSKERSDAFAISADTLLYLNDIHDQCVPLAAAF